ncbi:Sporulation related domain-containing protein [Poseidonocella pacifica]|uniref:Sporulation related domain-containing protein n=1 Tax=Poseidonocella pacifica TaxID=871651 RepID=A0A1I0YR21_9RHOB|nr:SPOR domain-containing protein [Poseidonocella pacifica]SFB15839.1 Sporulation related domain-containing protein [Poseidonocella pacifica]
MKTGTMPVVGVATFLSLAACIPLPDRAEVPADRAPAPTMAAPEDDLAPDVFFVEGAGLWDGRPSVGGIWVAHASASEPERVQILNPVTGATTIGAVFQRSTDLPGPPLQLSSDAARALGIAAGTTAQLRVTALRPSDTRPETMSLPQKTETARPEKPFIQVGIFGVEENARRAGGVLRREGILPILREQGAEGATYWRVVVGPAQTIAERDTLLDKVHVAGFLDAYVATD